MVFQILQTEILQIETPMPNEATMVFQNTGIHWVYNEFI